MSSKPPFLVFLVITFLVIITWVTFNIIHTRSSVPDNPKVEQVIQPINPNFDQKALDYIRQIL